MKVGVVIVLAGKGKRLAKGDKAALSLDRNPLFCKVLTAFKGIKGVKEIALVLRKSNFSLAKKFTKGENVTLVEGGVERTDSVFKGLLSLGKDIDYVLIHDGARPFVTKKIILDILKELKKHPAVICGLKCPDTLKLVNQGVVNKTLAREDIYLVQTPQGFKRKIIVEDYRKFRKRKLTPPKAGLTDDAQMLEAMGKPVKVIKGDTLNFKITYPQDILLAKAVSSQLVGPDFNKVGLGFDVHRLSRKKKDLVLGGAKIPSIFSLIAVSDGDVVLHAVSDALCGAAGLGDIGDYFPPQDKRSKGIDSKEILNFILKKVNKKYTIGNLDIVIATDKPRLFPYKGKITKSLKKLLSTTKINVKLKSKEGLNILGSKNSISCFAFVSLRKRKKK